MFDKFHSLYFETTRNCNLNCKYCSTGSSTKKKFKDLSFEDIVNKILNPAYELGTRLISFSGGEFLLREDAIRILESSNKIGFNIAMASNGILLNESKLLQLKDAVGDNLIISLGINSFDLLNKDTRCTETDFVLKKIELLEKHNIRINISVTIGKFNMSSFKSTIESINKLKLPFNRIPFVPRSCNVPHLMFDKESLKEYFHPILRKYYNGQVSYTPYFLPTEIYEKVSGQNLAKDQIPLNPAVGCWVGAYYAINPEGDVSPCPMFSDHVTAGNVTNMPLYDILYKTEMFNKLTNRRELEGKCGNCKYTYTCGGCRVMAYYKTGNIYAEDPTCFIDDLSSEELERYESETIASFKNYVRMAKFGKLYDNPPTIID